MDRRNAPPQKNIKKIRLGASGNRLSRVRLYKVDMLKKLSSKYDM